MNFNTLFRKKSIEDILVNQEKELSQKELVALCEILRSHLYLKKFWMIDNLCRDINTEKASKIVLIGVLRYCFSYKNSVFQIVDAKTRSC